MATETQNIAVTTATDMTAERKHPCNRTSVVAWQEQLKVSHEIKNITVVTAITSKGTRKYLCGCTFVVARRKHMATETKNVNVATVANRTMNRIHISVCTNSASLFCRTWSSTKRTTGIDPASGEEATQHICTTFVKSAKSDTAISFFRCTLKKREADT